MRRITRIVALTCAIATRANVIRCFNPERRVPRRLLARDLDLDGQDASVDEFPVQSVRELINTLGDQTFPNRRMRTWPHSARARSLVHDAIEYDFDRGDGEREVLPDQQRNSRRGGFSSGPPRYCCTERRPNTPGVRERPTNLSPRSAPTRDSKKRSTPEPRHLLGVCRPPPFSLRACARGSVHRACRLWKR